jgi:hypothetical protein
MIAKFFFEIFSGEGKRGGGTIVDSAFGIVDLNGKNA